MISTGGARAIRAGIMLGRIIALDVALSVQASDANAGWRLLEPYRGLHQSAYRRATDRAADAEVRRIIEERLKEIHPLDELG